MPVANSVGLRIGSVGAADTLMDWRYSAGIGGEGESLLAELFRSDHFAFLLGFSTEPSLRSSKFAKTCCKTAVFYARDRHFLETALHSFFHFPSA